MPTIPSLSGSYIDQTFQRLVQVSGSSFADGLGSPISFGGTTIPGGPITSIQFNSNSTFSGSANLTFNSASNTLTLTGSLIQGLAGNIASGEYSHAEGSITKAIGDYSHAEGDNTQAKGNYSHAEGQETMTLASGQYSHAEGYNTIASANYQHVQGQWNATSSVQSAFIVGNGTGNNNRSNLIHAAGSEVQITGSIIFNEGARITPTYYGNTYTGYVDIVAGGPDGFVELLSYNQSSSFVVDDFGAYLITAASGSQFLWQFKNNGKLEAPGGITAPSFTGSLFGTASFAVSASRAVTSSLSLQNVITASVSLNTITFTKGDGSTFPITVNTGSGGGSTTPGGSNTQIQYNNSNTFDGVPTLTYNGTTLTGTGSFSGSFTGLYIQPVKTAQLYFGDELGGEVTPPTNYSMSGAGIYEITGGDPSTVPEGNTPIPPSLYFTEIIEGATITIVAKSFDININNKGTISIVDASGAGITTLLANKIYNFYGIGNVWYGGYLT
jgi:hypothetical protein